MSSAIVFFIAVVVLAVILTLLVFGTPKAACRYFRTTEGRKVLKGIVLFSAFGLVMVVVSSFAKAEEPKGKWLAYGEVYLGVDYTQKLSPQCYAGGPNDRVTSNGGLRANIYQSADQRFEFNTKYTHHSCAFSPDRERYDALGVELTYRIW